MITNSGGPRPAGRPRVYTDADIHAATARVLSEVGHGRLTLATVAAELGATAPALVRRFGSKRGLLLAFAEWTLEADRERFRHARAAHGSPLAALAARFLAPDDADDLAGFVAVVMLYADYAADPAFRDVLRRRVAMFEAETTRLVEDARAVGELATTDPGRLGRALLASMTGTAFLGAADPGLPAGAWARDAFEVVLGPYRTQAGPPTGPSTEVGDGRGDVR
jgi:AcrR family transcriptional regulator